ncbi:hypothetical protein BJ085DRAFT_29807 [Dimargaris cristalligena]|uniref:Uncharacterized protein n=1 Tax=Dimargaris cristalligena TaxID=215637 RepID=A0A4Q0A0B0_9FUNG|nr:hypothetical protein BJ085DRAFT_29807 [Dimargaris cristalligena]|eukprot:RKP38861.1 hypothetical protein BJ085DRAFT_29807 [Dimargaris cristalligena]
MKVCIAPTLLAFFSFATLGRATETPDETLGNLIEQLLPYELRVAIGHQLSIGDFVRKADFINQSLVQNHLAITNRINKLLEDTSIALEAVETLDQRVPENSAQQILQFTADFYSLARLESWAQMMGSFLSEFQDIPLNQDTLDESSIDDENPMSYRPIEFFKLISANRLAPILQKETWRVVSVPALSAFQLRQLFPLVPYANAGTMVYLERIYRSTSTHFSLLHEPQSTMDTHFGTALRLAPESVDALQLARTPVGGSIELAIPMITWYLHHRQWTTELDKFFTALLRSVPSEAGGNGQHRISHVAGSVAYLSLTLAAIRKDSARVKMLSELLVTVEIFDGADQRVSHTFESQKQPFIECLAARDLTDVARFLANTWGVEVSLNNYNADRTTCWYQYLGSRWFTLTPKGELGVQVPINLLGITLEANQYMDPGVQTDFPSFQPVERAVESV